MTAVFNEVGFGALQFRRSALILRKESRIAVFTILLLSPSAIPKMISVFTQRIHQMSSGLPSENEYPSRFTGLMLHHSMPTTNSPMPFP